MEEFDDQLTQRLFDNFQFVNFTELGRRAAARGYGAAKWEADFALAVRSCSSLCVTLSTWVERAAIVDEHVDTWCRVACSVLIATCVCAQEGVHSCTSTHKLGLIGWHTH
jgi:hypothetical protein